MITITTSQACTDPSDALASSPAAMGIKDPTAALERPKMECPRMNPYLVQRLCSVLLSS
jgi:hypothetical protein